MPVRNQESTVRTRLLSQVAANNEKLASLRASLRSHARRQFVWEDPAQLQRDAGRLQRLIESQESTLRDNSPEGERAAQEYLDACDDSDLWATVIRCGDRS